MFLKKKWNKINVKMKLFLTSTLLIITSAAILYILMFIFLPRFYYKQKMINLNKNIDSLIETIKDSSIDEVKEELNDFSYNNNARIMIRDKYGDMLYSSSGKMNEDESEKKFIKPNYKEDKKIMKPFLGDMIAVQRKFYYNKLNIECLLTLNAPMNFIMDTYRVMILFVPFMIIMSIIIALIGAMFYSKMISRPLLNINNLTKDMASLDFSKKLEVRGNDEISELSKNINELSENLEKNINELKSDVEKEREQERKRREFIATISHELKSPITIISGQLEGMIYNIGPFRDRDKYLKKTYDTTKELQNLVKEILSISKIESYEFKANISNFNLSNLIFEILESQSYFIKEKEMILETKIEDNLIVKADKNLIKKAITNIINNAIKYSPKKELIKVNCFADNDIRLQIINTGVMIDKDEIIKIFDPFYRVEKSRNRQTGGTGLGLYIVNTIINMHDNIDLNIESIENFVQFTLDFKKINLYNIN